LTAREFGRELERLDVDLGSAERGELDDRGLVVGQCRDTRRDHTTHVGCDRQYFARREPVEVADVGDAAIEAALVT
jgi:hypothetical protein